MTEGINAIPYIIGAYTVVAAAIGVTTVALFVTTRKQAKMKALLRRDR